MLKIFSFFIMEQSKCVFIQVVRRVSQDSGNPFRTSVVNYLLGFSKIAGYLIFWKNLMLSSMTRMLYMQGTSWAI